MFIGESITVRQYCSLIFKLAKNIEKLATKRAQLWLLLHKASPPKFIEIPYKEQIIKRGKHNDIFCMHGGTEVVFVASHFPVTIVKTNGRMAVPNSGIYISENYWDSKLDHGSGE